MDLGLGIKAGCFRARRGERLRARMKTTGENHKLVPEKTRASSAGSRRIFRPKLDEGSSAGAEVGGRRGKPHDNLDGAISLELETRKNARLESVTTSLV